MTQLQPVSNSMFKFFDGTTRTPRKVQADCLDWLEKGWDESPIHAAQAPVGSGKSGLARAIQIATGATIITPSNILIDQYIDTYPKVNFLKGKTHYTCRWGVSCKDWIDGMEQDACGDCKYVDCRGKAAEGKPTFFNPMSYYYLRLQTGEDPKVIVVDEAHQVSSMVLALCSKRFRWSVYKFTDKCTNAMYLMAWMEEQVAKLRKLLSQYQKYGDWVKAGEIVDEIESIKNVLKGLNESNQNYAIWVDRGMYRGKPDNFLNVKPVRPPKFMINGMLACGKLVLMSGTLLKMDIDDLVGGREYRFIDLPSPIPKERRLVYYRPVSYPLNFKTDPAQIAASIEDDIDLYPGRNTMVHVTYSMSTKLARHFRRPVLTNTSEDKIKKVEFFKKNGGIFLASGCAEGLDLKDDWCRLNIIPKLSYPDLSDPVVQKRRALEDGDEWYGLEALKVAIQAAGRSTRHEKDESITIIKDPTFGSLFNRYRTKLPAAFVESLVWHQ
jgi:Rad3-related DNA helicase